MAEQGGEGQGWAGREASWKQWVGRWPQEGIRVGVTAQGKAQRGEGIEVSFDLQRECAWAGGRWRPEDAHTLEFG